MEQRIYIWFAGLLLVVAGALCLHTLLVRDSIPAILVANGNSRSFRHAISRHYYTAEILCSAVLLPLICAMFAFVAHRGQEIDPVSWFFVAGFYLVFAELWIDLDRVVAGASHRPFTTNPPQVQDPAALVLFAGSVGFGFWKWKQNAGPWLRN